MSSFRIRPHFRQIIDTEPATLQQQLVDRIGESGARCEVLSFPGYLTLRIPEDDQHFWSPQLNLSLETTEDGKSMVQGLYGPNTNVWSLYLYGYLGAGCFGLVGAVLGISQWAVGTRPWALWFLAAMVALVAGLYLLAQIGQKLGAQQTFLLHHTYETAIGEQVPVD